MYEADLQNYMFSNISMTTFGIHKYCSLICTCNVSVQSTCTVKGALFVKLALQKFTSIST